MPDPRKNIVEGIFYPRETQALLDRMPSPPEGVNSFLMLPHAHWDLINSCLQAGWPSLGSSCSTLLLLGPVHREPWEGAAFPQSSRFTSPLGELPLDNRVINKICTDSPLFSRDSRAHEEEHCLEIHLPMIRHFYPKARIIPLLLGHPGRDKLQIMAEILKKHIGEIDDFKVILTANMTSFSSPFQADEEHKRLTSLLRGHEPWHAFLKQGESLSSCALRPLALLRAAGLLPPVDRIESSCLNEEGGRIYYETWGGC